MAAALSFALSGASLCAQSHLLGDFNANPGMPGSSSPAGFAPRGNEFFFAATSPLVGRELWMADRSNGARMLADLLPGASGTSPSAIVPWGHGLAFLADLGSGVRPYFMDLNTRVVRSILATTGRLLSASRLTVSGTQLFFLADDGVSGAELWVAPSPGMAAQPVADIRAGAVALFAAVVPFGGGVAMIVDDGSHGYELWVSDGTASGTRLVRDLNPGTAWGASNTQPVVLGNELFFVGDDGTTGGELFAFDGVNVRLVAELRAGAPGSFPSRLTVAGNRLVFLAADGSAAGNRPAVSDGTAAGTQFVTGVGSVVNLVADASGRAWALTLGSPRDVAVIDSGATSARLLGLTLAASGPTNPAMAVAGSRLYFEVAAPNSVRGQVWTSDGTAAGSRMLIETRIPGSVFAAGYADGAMFIALENDTDGRELWLSDGSVAGTRLFADIDPSRPTASSAPQALGEVAGRTVLAVNAGSTTQLVATDGSTRNTGIVRTAGARAGWSVVAELDDMLLLFELDNGDRLVRTDGTPAGTAVVSNLTPLGVQPGRPIGIALDGGRAVFSASDNRNGQLWVSDGTAAQTRMLRDFGAIDFAPYGFAKVGAEVWFFGYAGAGRFDLWATDGTVAGTRMLTAVPQATEAPRMLGSVAGKVVFATSDRQTGYEPWVSDGTAAGTRLLLDVTPGATVFGPANPVAAAGRLLIPTYSGVVGTDGTPAGTVVLPGTRADVAIIGMGDHAFVVRATSPAAFLRTDGTLAGTSPVSVALPVGAVALRRVSESSFAIGVVTSPSSAGSLLVCDGTAAGTRVVSSNYQPGRIGVVDGGIVYAGSDNRFGIEPHVASIGATSQAVGLGCGAGAVPTLRADEPRLGQQMTVRGAQLGVSNVVLFGVPAFTPLRLVLPANGCSLFVAQTAAALQLPSSGELRVVVPSGFDLIGARVAAQLVTVDAAASLALSNGVRLTVGPR